MRYELRILGPVLLILLAGYLASYPSILEPTNQTPLTGFSVQLASTCLDPLDVVLRLSAETNAHAAVPTHTTYPYAVCANDPELVHTTCDAGDPNLVVRLSSSTNAHLEEKGQTNYGTKICYGGFSCITRGAGESCKSYEQCFLALSSTTNAHAAKCGTPGYDIKICCVDGAPPPADSDNDGVYDDGDGRGIGNNLCNPTTHLNLQTCDDNCKDTPNGPILGSCEGNPTQTCTTNSECSSGTCQMGQQDQDGDGAGDVCDVFPTDSCSIASLNDNCPSYTNCVATLTASWQSSSAVEGTSTTLTVTGDPTECANLNFVFRVEDPNTPGVTEQDPQPATIDSTGTATTAWEAEYHSGGSNTYYFQATSQQGIQVSSPLSSLLTVTAVSTGTAVCGDGSTQRSQGEECDEGTNNCQHTKAEVEATGSTKTCGSSEQCYNDCKLIPGALGASCTTESRCVGKPPGLFAVCSGTSTEIQYCIRGSGGCLQLSTPQACSSIGGVQQVCVRNAPSCQSPTCNYQYQVASCQDGAQQVTCTATGGTHCTSGCVGYPKTRPCFEEPKEAFPIFTGWNVLLTVLLLTTFYGLRRGRKFT